MNYRVSFIIPFVPSMNDIKLHLVEDRKIKVFCRVSFIKPFFPSINDIKLNLE